MEMHRGLGRTELDEGVAVSSPPLPVVAAVILDLISGACSMEKAEAPRHCSSRMRKMETGATGRWMTALFSPNDGDGCWRSRRPHRQVGQPPCSLTQQRTMGCQGLLPHSRWNLLGHQPAEEAREICTARVVANCGAEISS